MKNLINTFLLCLLSLSIVPLQAQEQDKKQKDKSNFQEKGELLIGIHGLNVSSSDIDNYPTLADQGLQFSIAKFHKNKKMRGLKIGYGAYVSETPITPAPSDVNWSIYGFRRGYFNKRRLSLFSEVGLGGDRHFVNNTLLVNEGSRDWWDLFIETRLGASARIGKRLGIEASIGVRMGTDNFLPDDDYAFKFRVVSGLGLNYYIRS